jgi:hypothetical protein
MNLSWFGTVYIKKKSAFPGTVQERSIEALVRIHWSLEARPQ